MICIYHSRDLDGWMSAAIIKMRYPNVELIGWDYGQSLPEFNPEVESEVIMVDVSFPKYTMISLMDVFNFVWIDHHISAIRDIGDIGAEITGIRDPVFAACELTWKYFFPEKPMPEIIRLLGRYDCFGHKGTPEEKKVLIFQYAARAQIFNPEEAYKALISITDKDINGWLDVGQGIYSYLCTEAQQIYKRAFSVIYGAYKIFAVNQERFNPINFGIDYHKDGYDAFLCFHYQNSKWMFSLYNDNGFVDCSVICKENGGGGHKGAAGFVADNLDFLFKYQIAGNKSNL